MHQVLEALIDPTGRVFLSEPTVFAETRRALVIVLDEATVPGSTWSHASHGPTEGALRYRIDRPLGAGGMGQTFVGTDLLSGRVVCVKRLRPGIRRELIEQEWRALSRVDSRYVVRFFDRYEHGGSLHLVMEYLDGPTLADRLERGFPAAHVAWLGLGLMRGLDAIHGLGAIHCDLKPQNVLIQDVTLMRPGEPGWIPKIIDFGLAILDRSDANGNLTGQGRFAGTPAYMAPEQAKGQMLSPACDIYAVGLILWEALTRRRASTGFYDMMEAFQVSGLRIEGGAPLIPADVVDLVEHCTHPNPSRRPSAADASAVLERWVASILAEALQLDPPGDMSS